jgi:hypothetical protein
MTRYGHYHTCTECGTESARCECDDYTPDWVCSQACADTANEGYPAPPLPPYEAGYLYAETLHCDQCGEPVNHDAPIVWPPPDGAPAQAVSCTACGGIWPRREGNDG